MVQYGLEDMKDIVCNYCPSKMFSIDNTRE